MMAGRANFIGKAEPLPIGAPRQYPIRAREPGTQTNFVKFTFGASDGGDEHNVCPGANATANESNVLPVRRPCWMGVLSKVASQSQRMLFTKKRNVNVPIFTLLTSPGKCDLATV